MFLEFKTFALLLIIGDYCLGASRPFKFNQDKMNEHCGLNAYDSKWSSQFPPKTSMRIDKRIVNGNESRLGEWPWLVSLRVKLEDGTYEHKCGGSLIHPQWVLTAEHCFDKLLDPQLSEDPKLWLARVGEHDMRTNDEVPHKDMKIKNIFRHKTIPGVIYSNDIALVQLEENVSFNKHINIACLPTKTTEFAIGTTCQVIGWGTLNEGDINHSPVLRHVPVPIVSNQKCNESYALVKKEKYNIISSMICAGYEAGGKDSCQDDSGGPLMCAVDGQWYVAGVVSFGYGCARKGFPGVNTRVTHFRSWIKKYTKI